MKFTNDSPNYCATIVRIYNLVDLAGRDRVKGFPCQGFQAIVPISYSIGELGVFFTPECQLSPDYCRENNLYRDGQGSNKDEGKFGFFESSGRVKALKFAGHKSNAIFMPLSSLSYLGIDINDLKEGDSFTSINGVEVCRKYVIKQANANKGNKTRGLTKKFTRIDAKTFPEHFDTDMYFKNQFKYAEYDFIYVTQKIHGTSARFANQKVRKMSKMEKFLNRVDSRILSVLDKKSKFKKLRKFKTWIAQKWYNTVSQNIQKLFKEQYEYDTLAGSRRVIKDTKADLKMDHYYVEDVWNDWLQKIGHLIPKNWIIYGEIIGWIGEKEIQPDYSYCLPKGTNKFYVYRISVVNEDGLAVDLTWNQIREWCRNNGLEHVPELWKGHHRDFKAEDYLDKRYSEVGYSTCLPLDKIEQVIDKKTKVLIVDEGVCIRKDGIVPYVTKAKSEIFYLHESVHLDKGEVDIETAQSEVENEENTTEL